MSKSKIGSRYRRGAVATTNDGQLTLSSRKLKINDQRQMVGGAASEPRVPRKGADRGDGASIEYPIQASQGGRGGKRASVAAA